MVKHSLFRHVILVFSMMVLIFSSVASAAEEDQIESDIMQEELNIGMDLSEQTSVPTSNAPLAPEPMTNQAVESATAAEQPTFNDTEFQANANSTEGYVIDERQPELDNTVTVERVVDLSLPYKQRRGKHGVLFQVGMENIEPTEYYSLVDDGAYNLEDMVGTSMLSLINVELGYKYNFNLGSAYVIGAYAMGSASDTFEGVSRKLEISRLNLSVGYAADMIFDEPWVVPYGQVGVHHFDINETKDADSVSATTEPSLNFRAGLLFQLNWIEKSIDPSTHSEGLRSSGLENTYLDVYGTWYEPSESSAGYDPNDVSTHDVDPDMRSEAQLGVALKMEF